MLDCNYLSIKNDLSIHGQVSYITRLEVYQYLVVNIGELFLSAELFMQFSFVCSTKDLEAMHGCIQMEPMTKTSLGKVCALQ